MNPVARLGVSHQQALYGDGNPVDSPSLNIVRRSTRGGPLIHFTTKIAATAARDSMKRHETMTSAHSLQGLMQWLTRAEWRDRFAEVYDHHLLPACHRTGFDAEEVIAILGENWFMTTVWGCAFEDFLTRES